MSTKNTLLTNISERLLYLATIKTGGNLTKYANFLNIERVSFFKYTKGRRISAEAAVSLYEKDNVNLNWLFCGEGPIYREDDKRQTIVDPEKVTIVNKMVDWMEEVIKDDPKREVWLEFELTDKIPQFAEWIKQKEEKGEE